MAHKSFRLAWDAGLVRNFLAMAVWQASSYLIPFLTFPYLTRVLGPEGYGLIGLGLAIAMYGVLFSDWGFNLSAAKQIAQARTEPDKLTLYFWNTIAAKAILSLFTLVLLFAALLFSEKLRSIAPVLFAAWLTVIAAVFTASWFLQGLERMGSFALAALIGKAITVPLTYAFVTSSKDVATAVAIQGLGGIVCAVSSLYLVARLRLVGKPKISLGAILAQLREGREVFLSTALISLYTNSTTVILGVVAGPAAVGLYVGSDKIRAAALGLVAPISNTVYPRLSWLLQESPARGYAFARRLLVIQGAITFIVALGLCVGARQIVEIAMGPSFLGAVPLIYCMAWIPFLAAIHNVWGAQLMIPLGMVREFRATAMYAAVCNLVLIGPLTWWLGALGAAISLLVTVLFGTVALGWALWRAGIPAFPGFQTDMLISRSSTPYRDEQG